MQFVFWESGCENIIAEIQGKDKDNKCLMVTSQEELKSSLGLGEMAVVIVDGDALKEDVGQIVENLKQSHPHCLFCVSHQNLSADQLKPLEDSAVKCLKRPYQVDDLLQLADQCRKQLFEEGAADMSQGGTEEIDVEGTLGVQLGTPDEHSKEESLNITSIQSILPEDAQEGDEGGGKEKPEESGQEASEEDDLSKSFLINQSSDDAESDAKSDIEKASLDVLGHEEEGGGESEEAVSLDTNILDTPPLEGESEPKEEGEGEESSLFESDLEEPEALEESEALFEEEGSSSEEGELEEPLAQQENASEDDPLASTPSLPEEDGQEESRDISSLSIEELKEEGKAISEHHDDELLQLKSNLEKFQEDRKFLLEKVEKMEREKSESHHKTNGLQVELDEAKIEIIFLKKRYHRDIDHLKYSVKLAQEKRDILTDKNKKLKQDLELAEKRVSLDTAKVREKEKVLEGQLELLKSDSQGLLKSRDEMITDLRRQVDSLKFNFETARKKGRELQSERCEMEDRLDYIKKNLQRIISSLDEELLAEKKEDPDKKIVGF